MADNSEKKVIIDVNIVDNFIKSKQNLDFWKAALKDAQKTGTSTKEDLHEIAVELAKSNNEFKQAKKEIEGAAKAEGLFNAITESTNKSLAQMQRDLTALKNIPLDNLSPDQIKEVKQKMADLTAEIQDYKVEIKALDTGEVFTNIADGFNAIVSSASALTNTMNVLGIESDGVLGEFQKKTTELIAIVQAMGIVTEYLEKKKYKLIVANLKNIATMIAEKTATLASAAAMAILGKSTDTTSTSFKLLRGAIISTGIGALVVLVGLLISNWENLVGWFKKGTDGISGFSKALDSVKEIAMGVYEVIKNYVLTPFKAIGKVLQRDFKGAWDEIKNGYNVVGNYQKGATEQMAKNQEAANEKIAQSNRKIKSEALLDEAEKLSKKLEVDRAMGKSAEELYKQEKEILDKRVEGYRLALDNIKDKNSDTYKEINSKLSDTLQQAAVKEAEETKRKADEQKRRSDSAQKARDKELEGLMKELDTSAKLSIARLKNEDEYQSEDIAKKSVYNANIFKLQEDAEKKKLDLQLKYKKISKSEYDAEQETLKASRKEFEAGQLKELNAYYKEIRESINGLIDANLDDQLKEVDEKYNKAINDLVDIKLPEWHPGIDEEQFKKDKEEAEKLIRESVEMELALEKERNEKKAEITKAHNIKSAEDIEKIINEQYEGDLAKFSDNERKKLEIEIESLQKIIKEKKDAGLQTYEDEAKLRGLLSQQNSMQLNIDLANRNLSAKKRYELTKVSLEKEAELYKDNADKQTQISQLLVENEKEYLNARIESFQEYSDQVLGLISGLSGLMSEMEDSQLQESEERNEKEKASLKDKLDKGVISQKEYDKQVAQLDKNLDKEKAEIARKQAMREKVMNVFQIGLNTAAAIMKIWAEVPKGDFGASTIALTAIVSAIGALQLATVLATPLPKAARGMKIEGASHASGGVLIETEGGEVVINKRSASMFMPLLSAINEAGGGIPFSAPMSDGGYSVRNSYPNNQINLSDLKEAISEAVGKLHIVTAIEDIRKGESKYSEIEDRANF